MRKGLLRRYLVFRVKVIEFFDIGSLRQGLGAQQFTVPTPLGRKSSDFSDSLRTVQLSWLALLIDKSKGGMDAIELWGQLFPQHKMQIQEAWGRLEPIWNTIRPFRDKAGFHADQPLAFFKARSDVIKQQEDITRTLEEFQNLLQIILKAEAAELPDLPQAVSEFLDELESEQQFRYNRTEFERYLMIPSTR